MPLGCIIEAGHERLVCAAINLNGGPEELLQLQYCIRRVHMRDANDVSGHYDGVQLIREWRRFVLYSLCLVSLEYISSEH